MAYFPLLVVILAGINQQNTPPILICHTPDLSITRKILFTQTTTLVQKLQQARAEYKLSAVLDKLANIPVLILDDIGYVKKSEAETSVLFELIAERYETNSLVITSNQPFSEWDQIFPDNVMAVAAIDRLVHHASIININEESYRKKHSN